MSRWFSSSPFAVALFVGACATTGGMQNAPPDAGVARSFEAPFDRVVAACRFAMDTVGIEIESSEQVDERTLMIIGDHRMSGGSAGEKVRVRIHELAQEQVEVRIYSKRKLLSNPFAKGDWSKDLFDRIQEKVGLGRVES